MLASFQLWKQWSDQALALNAEFWRRSLALSRLSEREQPKVAQTPAEVAYTENKLRLKHKVT